METEEIVRWLTESGFNQYQAQVYTYLLTAGSATAVSAASGSGVPKSRIYDTLEDLERMGYVETYEQDSLRARVLDPDQLLGEFRERSESLSEAAEAVEELWKEPSVDDYRVTLVKRQETVIERAKEFIGAAENEIQIVVTPEHFSEFRPLLQEAFGRDVYVDLLITLPEGSPVDPTEDLDFDGVATEVRLHGLEPLFMLLADRTRTCFAPQRNMGSNFGLIADNSILTYVFFWYFQTALWGVWETIYTTRNDDPPFEYVNIRQCVVDIAPLLAEDAIITVTIDGETTDTNEDVKISGTIVDVDFTGSFRTPVYPSFSDVAGQVTLYVDDGSEIRTVGGRFARLEEISTTRLTIEDIDFEDGDHRARTP